MTVKVAVSSISGKINDGEADIQIDSINLPAGQYNVVVDYYRGSSGGHSYDSSTESATFSVIEPPRPKKRTGIPRFFSLNRLIKYFLGYPR